MTLLLIYWIFSAVFIIGTLAEAKNLSKTDWFVMLFFSPLFTPFLLGMTVVKIINQKL